MNEKNLKTVCWTFSPVYLLNDYRNVCWCVDIHVKITQSLRSSERNNCGYPKNVFIRSPTPNKKLLCVSRHIIVIKWSPDNSSTW